MGDPQMVLQFVDPFMGHKTIHGTNLGNFLFLRLLPQTVEPYTLREWPRGMLNLQPTPDPALSYFNQVLHF